MATATKTWSFASSGEYSAWTQTTSGGNQTRSYDSGNARAQIQSETGRNKTSNGYMSISGTFASIFGIPTDSTITGYSAASFNGGCSAWTVMDVVQHGDTGLGALDIDDGTARTLIANQTSYTASGQTRSPSVDPGISGLSIPATTTLTVYVRENFDNGNNNGAGATIWVDDVSITVVYSAATQYYQTPSVTAVGTSTLAKNRILQEILSYTAVGTNALSKLAAYVRSFALTAVGVPAFEKVDPAGGGGTPTISGASLASGSGNSWTGFTVPSGCNKLIVFFGNGAGTDYSGVTATWNGTSMTALGGVYDDNWNSCAGFYLDDPATGNLTLAFSASDSTQNAVAFIPLQNAEAGAPAYGNWVSTDGSETNPSITVSGSASGDLVVGAIQTDAYPSLGGENGTRIGSIQQMGTDVEFGAQYLTATGASEVMSWTQDGGANNNWSSGIAYAIGGTATGTTYYQTPTFTSVATNSLSKVMSYVQSISFTGVATAVRSSILSLSRSLGFTSVGTSGMTKVANYLRSFSFINVATNTFSKVVTAIQAGLKSVWPFLIGNVGASIPNVRSFTYTGVGTSTVSRQISLLKSFTNVATSVLAQLKAFLRSLSFTGVATSTVSKVSNYLRSISYVGVGTSTLSRTAAFLRTFAIQSVATTLLTTAKSLSRILNYTNVGATALSRTASRFASFAYTAVATPAFDWIKVFLKSLTITAVGTATYQKVGQYVRSLGHTAVGTSTFSRLATLYRSFNYTGVAQSAFQRIKQAVRNFTFAAVATLAFVKDLTTGSQLYYQTRDFTAVATSGVVQKAVQKLVSLTSVATNTFSRAINYVETHVFSSVGSVTKQLSISKLFSITAVGTIAIGKSISKSLVYVAKAVLETTQAYATSLVSTITGVVSSVRSHLYIPFSVSTLTQTLRRALYSFLGRR